MTNGIPVVLLLVDVSLALVPPGLLLPSPAERISVPAERLAAALAWAERRVQRQDLFHTPASDDSAAAHHARRHSSDEVTQQRGREALVWVEASRAPAHLPAVPGGDGRQIRCPTIATVTCDFTTARYRTMDGTCNHRSQSRWGAADRPFSRLGPNTYDDGVNAARATSVSGAPLSSARRASRTAIGRRQGVISSLTLSVMQWGQFLDHDMTLTPVFLNSSGGIIFCCADGRPVAHPHPQCMPIHIPRDDDFFASYDQHCMEFVRSLPALAAHCQPGPAAQMNVLTNYLDGSMIYGSRTSRAHMLRTFAGGLLRVRSGNIPPVDPPGAQLPTELPCFSEFDTEPCFLGGDVRINDQVSLAVLHTIWMREHNRIASQLTQFNPHWSDEILYQEARKVVGAQIQHISYGEWLPIILGQDYMLENQIAVDRTSQYSHRYLDTLDPTISTEFSTAAFRFGHSLVQELIELHTNVAVAASANVSRRIQLRDVFLYPQPIYQGMLDQLAMGLVMQAPQRCDANVVSDLTNHLFQEDGHHFGMDLISLNVQRGRDHGISTYNSMRVRCGLARVGSFDELKSEMPLSVVRRLSLVYDHVDDIDLFIGAIAERPHPGAVVGPTMRCIIGDQFIKLRWSDNFFYDLGSSDRPWQFSRKQLKQLKKTSWARVLCDNIDSIGRIQKQAFRAADGANNSVRSCEKLSRINLRYWKQPMADGS